MHDALVAVLCWLLGGAGAATAIWLMCQSDGRRTAAPDGAGPDVSAQVRALLPRQSGPAD